MAVGGGDGVVQQVRRGFGVEGAVVEDHQPLLALDAERLLFLRQGGGNQAGRHVAVERNRAADDGAHRRQPGAFEKTAAVGLGQATEHQTVGPFRVRLIEFADAALTSGHGVSPLLVSCPF